MGLAGENGIFSVAQDQVIDNLGLGGETTLYRGFLSMADGLFGVTGNTPINRGEVWEPSFGLNSDVGMMIIDVIDPEHHDRLDKWLNTPFSEIL